MIIALSILCWSMVFSGLFLTKNIWIRILALVGGIICVGFMVAIAASGSHREFVLSIAGFIASIIVVSILKKELAKQSESKKNENISKPLDSISNSNDNICPFCKSENAQNANFCQTCGKKILKGNVYEIKDKWILRNKGLPRFFIAMHIFFLFVGIFGLGKLALNSYKILQVRYCFISESECSNETFLLNLAIFGILFILIYFYIFYCYYKNKIWAHYMVMIFFGLLWLSMGANSITSIFKYFSDDNSGMGAITLSYLLFCIIYFVLLNLILWYLFESLKVKKQKDF